MYDVVIDPGHGGSDVGAVNGRYMESEIALDCALELKTQLEKIGLKVLLTRDGTESEEEYTMYNIYDEDGRVTMANESHAKVLISLHLNSNLSDNVDGGVEIYASSNSDLTLAKKLADDIVETAKTEYSTNQSFQPKEEFIKTFSQRIAEGKEMRICRKFTEVIWVAFKPESDIGLESIWWGINKSTSTVEYII